MDPLGTDCLGGVGLKRLDYISLRLVIICVSFKFG